ncbi:MAG: response regulator [Treponema sp.]|nr:response regulator [Treponema sp.]
MNLLCVDDEPLILEDLVSVCREIDSVCSVESFTKVSDAINFVKDGANEIDVAILDIDMPEMNGLDLAKKLKEIRPRIEIIFLSGFSEFAVDAFKVRASGYLLKPVSKESLEEELAVIAKHENFGVFVRTFGNFDLIVNGKNVNFKWSKSKELFAYLVDRRGASVSRKELAAVIFMDKEYTRSNQVYITRIVQNLEETLSEYGVEKIFVRGENSYSVDVTKFNCDVYDYLDGDESAKMKFNGEYLSQYSWAEGKAEMLSSFS